jgi:hypothetical protein
LTVEQVRQRLESLGLRACNAIPGRGIDILARHPCNPLKAVRIEVKGRNPEKAESCRWFQICVSKRKLERALHSGVPADQAWMEEVLKADFFVLDAVRKNEMWVLSQRQVIDLIRYNESKYANRPDNVFVYSDPVKAKQKEMNLDLEVDGIALTERFRECLDNFEPIMAFLRDG